MNCRMTEGREGKTIITTPVFDYELDKQSLSTQELRFYYVNFDEFYAAALHEAHRVSPDGEYRNLLRFIWNEYLFRTSS